MKDLAHFTKLVETPQDKIDYLEVQASQLNSSPLKKRLKWPELILLGIGCTIGAGIFVLTGIVARDKTGPALFLSFIFSGLACLLSAFSYAEFASMSPNAGSAYGFSRATLGEFAGWVIGWDLVLEYAGKPISTSVMSPFPLSIYLLR